MKKLDKIIAILIILLWAFIVAAVFNYAKIVEEPTTTIARTFDVSERGCIFISGSDSVKYVSYLLHKGYCIELYDEEK